jgi:3-mercaptopyruvate sulfurtransferase SseA
MKFPAVLEYNAPQPGETRTMMEDKLRFHTDSWDLSVDLKAGVSEIIVIDARSRDAYAAGHIPGATSFPHREMSAETTARLDRSKIYVVYCDGIGCNQGRAQTRSVGVSHQGVAGRPRLVESRRTPRHDFA